MPKSNTPFSTKLPARGALKALDQSKRTIVDYAKKTPIVSTATQSPVTEMIKKPRR
jgi:hypothetical protein